MTTDRRKGDRRVPPALAEFAVSQLAEAGEQTAIDLAVQNVEILRAEVAKRDAAIETLRESMQMDALKVKAKDARIAELEADRDRIKTIADNYSALNMGAQVELAALKARQPSAGVVLPERMEVDDDDPYAWVGERAHNACLDEVASLNPCRAQSVPDGYVLVPVEPTIEMIAALGFDGDADLAIGHAAISAQCVETYRKLLAAAQAAGAQSVIGGVDLDDVRGALASAHSAIVYQGQSVSYEYALRRVSKALHDLAAAPSAQQKESE